MFYFWVTNNLNVFKIHSGSNMVQRGPSEIHYFFYITGKKGIALAKQFKCGFIVWTNLIELLILAGDTHNLRNIGIIVQSGSDTKKFFFCHCYFI